MLVKSLWDLQAYTFCCKFLAVTDASMQTFDTWKIDQTTTKTNEWTQQQQQKTHWLRNTRAYIEDIIWRDWKRICKFSVREWERNWKKFTAAINRHVHMFGASANTLFNSNISNKEKRWWERKKIWFFWTCCSLSSVMRERNTDDSHCWADELWSSQ